MLVSVLAGALLQPLVLVAPVQDKNFYVLSLLERTPVVREIIRADSMLSRLRRTKYAAFDRAFTACGDSAGCFADTLAWTDAEVAGVQRELVDLYHRNAAVAALSDDALRRSGVAELARSRRASTRRRMTSRPTIMGSSCVRP